jgi:hypothetical protein
MGTIAFPGVPLQALAFSFWLSAFSFRFVAEV